MPNTSTTESDPEATQPCAAVASREHTSEAGALRDLDEHQRALRATLRAEVRAEVEAEYDTETLLMTLACRDAQVSPELVVALRDGVDTRLTIGETDVAVALSPKGHGVGDAAQILGIWKTIIAVFHAVSNAPYVAMAIRQTPPAGGKPKDAGLPEEVASLRWSTPSGPVTVLHTTGAHRQATRMCRSRP